MDEYIKEQIADKDVSISDLKFYFYIATTAIGVILYLNTTFATVAEVKSLKQEVMENKIVLCKIAIAVDAKVEETCARYK